MKLPQRIIEWVETSPLAILIGLALAITVIGGVLCFAVDRTLGAAVFALAGP